MDIIDPRVETLTVTYDSITYSATYYKPATKITGITDEAYPNWTAGTTFAEGDFCIVPELKRKYRSASSSNTGNFPPIKGSIHWVDYGAINSYLMFSTDQDIGAQSIGTDVLLEFNFNTATAIAGVDIRFDSAHVMLIDTSGITYKSDYIAGTTYLIDEAVIFDQKLWVSLQNANTGHTPDISPTFWAEAPERVFFSETIAGTTYGVATFAGYFFDPIVVKTRSILTGLYWLPSSILRIKMTGETKLATICYGTTENLGCTIVGAKLRHESTSKFKVSDFTGFREVIRYGKARLLEGEVIYDTERFGYTSQIADRIMDRNIVWIPTKEDKFSEAISLGYIEQLEIPMEVATKTKSNVRIVGVNK